MSFSQDSNLDTRPETRTQAIQLDNTCDYQLVIINPDLNTRQNISHLEEVYKEAVRLAINLTGTYIWQKEEFQVSRQQQGTLHLLSGSTLYGDSVDDEWIIVFLLQQLTLQFNDLWIHINDNDGEFLLTEAASVVPNWINPECDSFRVWLHQGRLLLLPPDDHEGLSNPMITSLRALDLSIAVEQITNHVRHTKKPTKFTKTGHWGNGLYGLYHSAELEQEAFYRIRNFPDNIAQMMHHALIAIPRKLIYILHHCPKSLAPAIEQFYLRDPLSLDQIFAAKSITETVFPPRDFAMASVKFSKILYAQLRSQRFLTPPPWKEALAIATEQLSTGKYPAVSPEKMSEQLEMGIKLTIGFELLVRRINDFNSRSVRELALLLQDLEEDGGDDALPSDSEMAAWTDIQRDDDDSWLDIDFAEFERELNGQKIARGSQADSKTSVSGFGDTNAQESLRKIVSRFEAFLNDDNAGIDGINLGDEMDMDNDSPSQAEPDVLDELIDDLDQEVLFDETVFRVMIQNTMEALHSESSTEAKIDHNKPSSVSSSSKLADKEDNVENALDMMDLLEFELKQHGALSLSDPDSLPLTNGKKRITSRGDQSAAQVVRSPQSHQDQEDDTDAANEKDEGYELDIDFNLAKNLLESFKSQAGIAGPTGNLLGLLGFQLPRDEERSDSQDTKDTPTNKLEI